MKKSLDELAILGGKPAFEEQIHVGRPNIGDRQNLFKRINNILDTRWLSNGGPYVREFEKRIAEKVGVKHCIATCNGTLALEIAIKALGLSGEVIVPSFTFIATAHALQWQQITPVFGDIDPKSYHLDPLLVEKMITPRTTGIMGVHIFSRPCDIDALTKIARNHHLKLLFDATQAFSCTYKGHLIGGFGDAEVFSFHATKIFNAFEGGAIVTNDEQLAEKVRRMKNYGFKGYDNVISIGTNSKMSEVSAAMGLTGLESFDNFLKIYSDNYRQYKNELSSIPGIHIMEYDETEKCNYQYIVVEIDKKKAIIDRDQLVGILHAENILARRYYFPGCHRMEPYLSHTLQTKLILPETEKLVERVIILPTGTTIGEEHIRKICQIIRLTIEHGDTIKKKLKDSHPLFITPKRPPIKYV